MQIKRVSLHHQRVYPHALPKKGKVSHQCVRKSRWISRTFRRIGRTKPAKRRCLSLPQKYMCANIMVLGMCITTEQIATHSTGQVVRPRFQLCLCARFARATSGSLRCLIRTSIVAAHPRMTRHAPNMTRRANELLCAKKKVAHAYQRSAF